MKTPPSSYEMMVSFADGELDIDDRELLLTLLDLDADLNRQVWELRKLKDMVELSYQELPQLPESIEKTPRRATGWGWQLATALSVAALTFVSYLLFVANGAAHQAAVPAPVAAAEVAPTETRILLHLTHYSRDIADELLNEVEYLLRENRTPGRPIRIEVVVNGRGLDLLRANVTDFPDRIRRLHDEFGNVTFAACNNTLQRLQRETGETIVLVPEAVIVNSGVVEAIQRQRQGWVYIDV